MALIKCIDCGKEISDRSISCPHCGCPTINSIAQIKTDEYRQTYKCKHCGNTTYTSIENQFGLIAVCDQCGYAEHITHKMPDLPNPTTSECPYCHSTNTKKISGSSRVASFLTFGLASKKVGKQWHCNECGSDF